MGITAKELAKKLNLSEAAISMALNHKPGVSTTTRKKVLEEAGLVKQVKDGVKVLGEGALNVALTVQANKFSKTAIEKIEAAGGKAEVI